jgi:xanthine dehydrogenase iron-sulfur cluster and FAD-binding subunit A
LDSNRYVCDIAAFMLKSQQRSEKQKVVVSTSGVKELFAIRHDEHRLFIGAQTSMTQLESTLTRISGDLPGRRSIYARLNLHDCCGIGTNCHSYNNFT